MSDPYVPILTHPRTPLPKQAEVTKVLAGSSAEQISSDQRFYKTLSLTGKQGNNTNNGASVFVGFNSTNQPFEITSGTTIEIESDRDAWPNDLSRLWLSGTAGDGVVATFQEGIE